MSIPNIPASIQKRLRNRAVQSGEEFDLILARYAVERFLFRLSSSAHSSQFVLKGAVLFYLWNEKMHRPTRDLDLLGFGPSDTTHLEAAFREIIAAQVPDDGLVFQPETLSVTTIREDTIHGGLRVKLLSKLGKIRIPLQVDVGYGDAITPSPNVGVFPTLLPDFPAPAIRSYPVYTVVAEKLEAMVSLGARNTRMKDFFDLRFILTMEKIDPAILEQAVLNTFERRKTPMPTELPYCLTPAFAELKEQQWRHFVATIGLPGRDEKFVSIIETIRSNLAFTWAALAARAPKPPGS